MSMDNMLKERILNLRSEGKTYDQIKTELGCSKSTISYHCSQSQKEKSRVRTRLRREDKLVSKFETFKYSVKGVNNKFTHFKEKGSGKFDFSLKDVHTLIAEIRSCYLCGTDIDYEELSSFHFDHKIPVSRGGLNTLENLGLACRSCNQAKMDLLPQEFIDMCRRVVNNNDV